MKKTLKIFLIVSFIFMGTVAFVSAAGTVSLAKNVTLMNPLKPEYDTFTKLVAGVTEAAVKVMMPFVVIMFIYAGFVFVQAQGKPEEIKKAKEVMFWSVIGAFILLGAWSFAQIIGTTVKTITNI